MIEEFNLKTNIGKLPSQGTKSSEPKSKMNLSPDKEFSLIERLEQAVGDCDNGCMGPVIDILDDFIKMLEKRVIGARMYADMDEPEFWASSTISSDEAEKRAKYLEEFLEEIYKFAGDRFR